MRRIFIIILLQLVIINWLYGNPQADSLERKLKIMPKDINYLRTAEKYIWYLINPLDDTSKAKTLLEQNKLLAQKLHDNIGLFQVYFFEGLMAYRVNNYEESKRHFQNAHLIVQKHKLAPQYLQKILTAKAINAKYSLDNENALKYALEAVRLTEKHQLREYITQSYEILAKIYADIDSSKSEEMYKKLLPIAYSDTDLTQRYLSENAIAYYFLDKNNVDKALVHAEKSLRWVEKYGRKANYSMAWSLLAEIYLRKESYDKAKYYLEKSVKMSEEINDVNRLVEAYSLLSYFNFQHLKNYDKAIFYAKRVIETAEKSNNPTWVYGGKFYLADMYAETKDYKRAYELKNQAYALKDSVYSKEWALKFNKLELEKKDSELKMMELGKKNATLQRNIWLAVGVSIIVISVAIIYILLKRARFKRIEDKQKIRNKLSADLHDEIGSTLSSIAILTEMADYQIQKGQYKTDIMRQVSEDARMVINKMDEIIWTINPNNDEFLNLEAKIKSFAVPLLETQNIDFSFDFSEDLEGRNIEMEKRKDVYLILKEAINNAIKYSECKNLWVKGDIENGKIKISVKDNGKGFDLNGKNSRNGLGNMQKRAENIGGRLNIYSEINQGTTVQLEID